MKRVLEGMDSKLSKYLYKTFKTTLDEILLKNDTNDDTVLLVKRQMFTEESEAELWMRL